MKYSLVRRPGAGKPPARFDERDVETEHGEASEAPATERAGNRYAKPKTTAPHLDSTSLWRGERSQGLGKKGLVGGWEWAWGKHLTDLVRVGESPVPG